VADWWPAGRALLGVVHAAMLPAASTATPVSITRRFPIARISPPA
jgi:hypothetical protein